MAKVFNGRAATEEYMSTHSLTFSTPEMTLRKYALWLGELVSLPGGERGPRLLLYLEEKGSRKESELAPDTDDSFRPTGAVTEMYGGTGTEDSKAVTSPEMMPFVRETTNPKYCISCGNPLRANVKFCTKCGTAQG
jgi:hypothetical protein